MATLYIMVGIPASGKSTYARKLAKERNCNIHSSDDIRRELCGTQQNLSNDGEVWKILKARMREDLLNGKDSIVDATNISIRKRSSYLNYIKDIPCKKVVVVADIPIEEAIKRNSKRPKEEFIPYSSLYNLKKAYEEPSLEEGFDEIIKI